MGARQVLGEIGRAEHQPIAVDVHTPILPGTCDTPPTVLPPTCPWSSSRPSDQIPLPPT